jgi:hypothetical protein
VRALEEGRSSACEHTTLKGIKLASGERKAISIFVSNQIRTPRPAIVESNDIARVISAHKPFANWLTKELHWIHIIPIFSLLNPIGSWGQRIVPIKKSEQIVHILLKCFAVTFKTINRLHVTLHYSLCRRVAAGSV